MWTCFKSAYPHILRIEGVEIVGMCDIDEENTRDKARQFGIQRTYRDASSLLKEASQDVVHVLTPPQSHKQLSIQAMEAGCHVLVEKPMALNTEEADEMIAVSRRHRIKLCICHNYLFDPAIMEAREMVAKGSIGEVIAVDAFFSFYHKWNDRMLRVKWLYDLPGSIFHETAPHVAYLQTEFLKNVKVVSAVSKKVGNVLPSAPSDELRILLEGDSGLGSFAISWNSQPYIRYLNIYGADKSIQVDFTLVKFEGSIPGNGSKNIYHSLQLLSRTAGNAIQTLRDRRPDGHRVLIEKFYQSLFNGTEPPVTGEDGRANVAILDQIWAALDCNH
ncbi:MAG: Gfo/Idh/MocA family protein [Ignavibacteriales bacterium]